MIEMTLDEVAAADIHHIKYVGIGDKVYAVALTNLIVRKQDYDIKCRPLEITQELIESLPLPTRSYQHIDRKFLELTPIVMFEDPVQDGQYWRFDGRHRIWGAFHNSLTHVPALWVPREVWGIFVIGREVKKDRTFEEMDNGVAPVLEFQPWEWDFHPLLNGENSLQDEFHFEPNFKLPALSLEPSFERYRTLAPVGRRRDLLERETLADGLSGTPARGSKSEFVSKPAPLGRV